MSVPRGRRPRLDNPRLDSVLEVIKSHIQSEKIPPTIREICVRVGVPSTSLVRYYLELLERRGDIRLKGGTSRGIVLSDKHAGAARTFIQAKLAAIDGQSSIDSKQFRDTLLEILRRL